MPTLLVYTLIVARQIILKIVIDRNTGLGFLMMSNWFFFHYKEFRVSTPPSLDPLVINNEPLELNANMKTPNSSVLFF